MILPAIGASNKNRKFQNKSFVGISKVKVMSDGHIET
jgi:hypothetical protein